MCYKKVKMGGGWTRPVDNRCKQTNLAGLHQSDTNEVVSQSVSGNIRTLNSSRTAYDYDGAFGGWKACYPPTHGSIVHDRQRFDNSSRYTGSDAFLRYNADGSKVHCKQFVIDYGWEYKSWSANNSRVYQPNQCEYYNRPVPAIRKGMATYELPYVFNGVTKAFLSSAANTDAQLGAMAGNITRLVAPRGFFVRAFTGGNFAGASTDYTGPVELGAAGRGIRSIQVAPTRPVLISRKDNPTKVSQMAFLLNDHYKHADLDDGIFSTTERVVAGILGLWVPAGFRVTIRDDAGVTRSFFGHNSDGVTWVSLKPVEVRVSVVLPLVFGQANYTGFGSALVPGDNALDRTRPVRSLLLPKGYSVTLKMFGKPNDTRTTNAPALPQLAYTTATVAVKYNVRNGANMIDNFPVRTSTHESVAGFEEVCKKECDAKFDCTAYYAVRMMQECPNPTASQGEDPATNGCKQVCGFYDGQNDNMRNAAYKAVEPYLFQGKLSVKTIYDA